MAGADTKSFNKDDVLKTAPESLLQRACESPDWHGKLLYEVFIESIKWGGLERMLPPVKCGSLNGGDSTLPKLDLKSE